MSIPDLSAIAIRQLGERINESQRVLYLNCGGKKVGNSGNLNPRVSRSERRCPTEKSDTAAARERDLKRSYHETQHMSSTFRQYGALWSDWL